MSPTPSITRSPSMSSNGNEKNGGADPTTISVAPYSACFADSRIAEARKAYLRLMVGGIFMMIVLVVLCYFSIYWGALYKVPDHQLPGWILNFDDGIVGQTVMQGFLQSAASSTIRWEEKTGVNAEDVGPMILEQHAWAAVVINSNATNNLGAADASYNGTSAVTIYGVEARSENAFRNLIRPVAQATIQTIADHFAQQRLSQLSNETVLHFMATSPQALTKPISFTLVNLAPFNQPVGSAITFVGLIYLMILSFFIVMLGLTAREASGLERSLTTASLIRLRLISVFVAYFVLSLFYSLLSLAFQVDFTSKFGHSGFVIFWMLNWVGMLSVGLALEAMLTLLTVRFVGFFMILFVIVNVSVCFMPIEVLPRIYRYGYAMQFYNVSGAVRTILFGTKNELGLHFGILIAWAALSCITMPLFQWLRRRVAVNAASQGQ
ncbi:hypothetical protein CYLTODRAFT_421258 [Cylindrobasidium torrendii FP15055 ss-10]|uniref:DUF3533 domain-containing protein n=1 Tax=Cylindrobasidium torrendii FP15055 ss-10 TaxID=1314674 RepID=A0A0D7BGN0_9AGAR|nr:hypothetical protein CYLTODRAFT_421258 [Cylindrobasidium torrendii FP15055 ss-10]